jgi:hypothetical protein
VPVYSDEDLERQRAVDAAQDRTRLARRHASQIREDLEYRALRLREALGPHAAAPITCMVDDLKLLQRELSEVAIALDEVA